MIVKNEEAMLARCLESVKGVDEIIIVDTGSTDKTKEIASQFTDKIFDFEWCDDFAKARNFALDNCSGDWVLSIDADEVLEEGGIEKIREYINSTNKNSLGILMRSGNNAYHVPRLFRNIVSIKWVGKIHELPSLRQEENTHIAITYYSSPAHTLDPKRNLRILQSAYIENPDDTRTLFYLGREYAYYQEWAKAIKIFEKYLTLSVWLPERADAYFMLALCYWYTQEGEKARVACLSAININANFKVAIQLMGHMSFAKNKVQWDRMAETATNEDTLFARINFLTI